MTTGKTRTSETDPLYVNWLPSPPAPSGPGRVGLTMAPGKHQTGLYSGIQWRRDLAADLDRLRDVEQAEVLVCLLEDHEFGALNIPGYFDAAAGRGFEVLRLPIGDGGIPRSPDAVAALVAEIGARVRAGRRVVVHCAGGLGRAGTIAGCWLVSTGLPPADALGALRALRGDNCPETAGQRAFIHAFVGRSVAGLSFGDRCAGAVLGAAIGDAMGHPTEFLGMAEIHASWGPRGVTGFELFWERGGRRFAPYTDDTQMAEVVLRTLLDAGNAGENLDAAMRRMADGFIAWSRDPQGGHRAPGRACLAGCRSLAAGVPWDRAGRPDAGGCGSVMRAYPFGLVFNDVARAEEWAVAHSKLTHRAPIALAACAAMAVGMVRVVGSAPVGEVLEAMIAAAGRYSDPTAAMMQRAWDEARAGVGPDVTLDRLRAWAAHEAIAAAVYIFARHADDPRAAILEGANTPGDSDSIATLVGALAGARCGVASLPADWIRDLERTEELRCLAERIPSNVELGSP